MQTGVAALRILVEMNLLQEHYQLRRSHISQIPTILTLSS